jgi:hypothetical protein
VSRSEHVEQREIVAWFRKTYPGVRIFAIPNGGHRHKLTAARLKVEGVTAGVPDLFIPAWRLWVEVKTPTGRLSPAQRDWLTYLEGIGYRCLVAYGLQDFQKKMIQNLDSY